MVTEPADDRATETFSFRMSSSLKSRLEVLARASRRTLGREILARLSQSVASEPDPAFLDRPLASDTAVRALSMTEKHAERLKDHEARLIALEKRLPRA